MPRQPFRIPGNKLVNTFSYDYADEVFLEMIKPWSTDHYKEKAGSANNNNRIRKIKEEIRSRLFVIQDSYCAFCGIDLWIAKAFHREHIVPQSQDTDYIFEPKNLVMACYDCNDFKSTRHTLQHKDVYSYHNCTFLILHPFKDNFGDFFISYYEKGGLYIDLIDGITDIRAENTIKFLGFKDPKLIVERGMRIRNASIPCTEDDDDLIRQICNVEKRKNNY
jgi:uncharacterized protein (TIGR02646 family)